MNGSCEIWDLVELKRKYRKLKHMNEHLHQGKNAVSTENISSKYEYQISCEIPSLIFSVIYALLFLFI